MLLSTFAVLAVFAVTLPASVVSTQLVPAPEDLTLAKGYANYDVRYKQVPDGICETTEGVKSWSG